MPVYLCQPGQGASEPWRHGIQVYATPFLMDGVNGSGTGISTDHTQDDGGDRGVHASQSAEDATNPAGGSTTIHPTLAVAATSASAGATNTVNNNNNTNTISGGIGSSSSSSGTPIRRIRHAEVVLVDDVCIAYGRHWLRLRWPGHRGGFAGYIALGRTTTTTTTTNDQQHSLELKEGQQGRPAMPPTRQGETASALPGVASSMSREEVVAAVMGSNVNQPASNTQNSNPSVNAVALSTTAGRTVFEVEERDGNDDDIVNVDSSKDDEPQDNASTLSAEPLEASSPVTDLVCSRNRLVFPSSVAMKLLTLYDDGFTPPVMAAPLPSEPVFCRICREGLHDDADDEQPTPAVENDADDSGGGARRGRSGSPSVSSDNLNDGDNDNRAIADERQPVESDPMDPILSKGPILPHPTYHANPHAAENPMLSPCECSGSMAFVHYMCVEQWRCRSRHPKACQGLNCETCGKLYALPPPSARPADIMQVDNEDWLEAMPPHVLEALRRPHIWWQIGSAAVRRRWLRPIAPVVMSPIVALYCRSRRMLKKRGVARRRWACSLCRRRARWKCVRCLRSYYCSRQCQNVSWHIVHKHVCYKPSRWIWSLIFYGAVFLLAFPGSLRDPLLYDLGLGAIPASFYLTAVMGGGFATAMKKGAGVDLRGRALESAVVIYTVFLVTIVWGLIGGFFGQTSKCYGVPVLMRMYYRTLGSDNAMASPVLKGVHRLILMPAQNWFHRWDALALSAPTKIRRVLCMTGQEEGCFEYAYKANANFIVEESKCASDMLLVTAVVMSAIVIGVASYVWKQRERQRRAARRARPHARHAHEHQD